MRFPLKNIYCVARNYALHAKELNNEIPDEPVIFLKSTTSVRSLSQGDIAFADEQFHYEAEVVCLIGKDTSMGDNLSIDVIDSFALGIDLTRRKKQTELKKKGHPWTLSKSFYGSALIGEFKSRELFQNPKNISFKFTLNDVLKQNGNTKNMIFSLEKILNYLNSFTPLLKGDIIFTGTPEGVGHIQKGDSFEMEFPEIGHKEKGHL